MDLEAVCEKAIDAGREIDLSDCHYGDTVGSEVVITRPTRYYYFLAGLVRSERLSRILEIGTNCGGSIMSIYKGIQAGYIEKSRIVTVDIERKNNGGFNAYPGIRRIHGDSLDDEVIEKAVALFEDEIDLIYIDSLHEYGHTKRNIDVYARRLNPRYLVLDDIRQCDEMCDLWRELKAKFGDNAFDASEIIRRSGAGFGIINWRGQVSD
jgi:cephalosporin hydroxylase